MISLLIAVVLLIFVVWLLTQIPLPAPWGNILIGVIVIGFLIFLLRGGVPGLG
jgi:hypothetical protein